MSFTSIERHYKTPTEIETFVRNFESGELPHALWTHAAHLTVALWYLVNHEWAEAVDLMREGIKRHNAANGIVMTRDRGYHETLTVFWMRYVSAFLANSDKEVSLLGLANELVASADRNRPLEHYSRERLFSWEARLAWVEPDLRPIAD